MKRILLVLFICLTSLSNIFGQWGDSFRTIGFSGGQAYYPKTFVSNLGINYDHYAKWCTGHRNYFSIEADYGFIDTIENKHLISLKITKGFMRPFYWSRSRTFHPVASIDFNYFKYNYKNNLNIRPEIGFFYNSEETRKLNFGFGMFYGYEFSNKNLEGNKLKGNVIGFKLNSGFNFYGIRKKKIKDAPMIEDSEYKE